MAKPNNSIKGVKLPNNTQCEIIPDRLGSGSYVAELHTLTADTTLITNADIASSAKLGIVKVDGTSINIDSAGTISTDFTATAIQITEVD